VPALFEGKAKSGKLRVVRGGIDRQFHISRGTLVHACSNEPREHLAQVLADLNILDTARAAAAFETAAGSGMPLGTFLVDRGFVDRARMLEALAHKARETLFDCYRWEAGEIEFGPSTPLPRRGVELKLPLGSLHRDALAREREWRVFREVFPEPDSTFQVFREWAAVWGTEQEETILELAEQGATLAELLASEREGPLFTARRILQLYRRGVMSPRPPSGRRIGESVDLTHLLETARALLASGEFESAAAVIAQALERAPVTEAQALFREAEARMAPMISDAVSALEGRLQFEPLPKGAPAHLTADDFFLYSRLRGSREIQSVLRTWAMGELAAFRCLQRLLTAGVVTVAPASGDSQPRRKTDPFGLRVLA
jgi:hypothetical protein